MQICAKSFVHLRVSFLYLHEILDVEKLPFSINELFTRLFLFLPLILFLTFTDALSHLASAFLLFTVKVCTK